MKAFRLVLAILLVMAVATAQEEASSSQDQAAPKAVAPAKAEEAPEAAPAAIIVPAGTKVPLVLKHAVSTKNAQVGDNLYLESTFPVVQNNRMVIPPGTYVQGVVAAVKRPGRIKGRAELLIHFTTMIFPNG